MNYVDRVKEAKDAVAAKYGVETEKLEVFWSGTLMELQRMFLRRTDGDEIYLASINTQTDEVSVKRYMPE